MNVFKKIYKRFSKKHHSKKTKQHSLKHHTEGCSGRGGNSSGSYKNQGWYRDPATGVKTDGNGNYLIEDYQSDWYMIMGK